MAFLIICKRRGWKCPLKQVKFKRIMRSIWKRLLLVLGQWTYFFLIVCFVMPENSCTPWHNVQDDAPGDFALRD